MSNGPTLAFKDIALQLLGNLFEYVLARDGRTLNILGATSGDTGSSAEYAMRGKRGIDVFMLSPKGRMSPFQTGADVLARTTPNIHNIAVEGTFDDCQDIVKAVIGDAAFKARYAIGAVNSINWARVAAQVVYYFTGYFAATRDDAQRVDFAVPSGNFGNILAGHVAREMGLPIRRLILATNENDVLDEFFRTGRYRPRASAETHATSSPVDGHLEGVELRALRLRRRRARSRGGARAVGAAASATAASISPARRTGRASRAAGFVSGRSTHADRIATIRDVHARYGVVIDPHTADGVKVGRELRDPAVPLVCIETALPAKFAATIREALGREPARPAAYADLEARPQRFSVIPADAARVKQYIEERAAAA